MGRWRLLFAVASIGSAHAQSFRNCPTICPEMVTIPAGSASLGPASGEEECEGIPAASRQGDQRKIKISRPFAMGKYEVTRGEFAAFVAATGHEPGSSCWGWDTGGVLRDAPGRPVTDIG